MALEDKQGCDNILGGVFSNLSDAGAFRISWDIEFKMISIKKDHDLSFVSSDLELERQDSLGKLVIIWNGLRGTECFFDVVERVSRILMRALARQLLGTLNLFSR